MQRYLIAWNVFTIAISTLLALPKMYNIPTLTPTLIFWIHKLTYFFFTDVFHGVILPLNMIIPWNLGRPKVGQFYVRKPTIEPRRTQSGETGGEFLSRIDGETGKSKRRRQRRIREEEDAGVMELYDVQPSTSRIYDTQPSTSSSYQQSQTLSSPTPTSGTSSCESTPSPLLQQGASARFPHLSFRRVLQVQSASCTPEPLPKVFRRAEFEGGRRRSTTIYCRTCAAAPQKGKEVADDPTRFFPIPL